MLWFILLGSSLVVGCSTKILQPLVGATKAYDELYLRGVFTWWEADPKYKLQKTQGDRYATTIKLIADGQPYDFKFSDADWTPGLNCGYRDKDHDQLLVLDQDVTARCDGSEKNFKFIPVQTSVYEFSIDFTQPELPTVVVRKVE